MGVLDERPVWSMSGGEKLSALDAVNAEIARLKTRSLHLIAGLDDDGYAEEIGAHDTARLLALRYRVDSAEAHRNVRLARALPKYPTVAAALPDTTTPATTTPDSDTADPEGANGTARTDAVDTDDDGPAADGAAVDGAGADNADGAGDGGGGGGAEGGAGEVAGGVGGRPLHPAQAQAIVWSLERVAARVSGEHLAVAEEQLVGLAAHLSPGELRKAGKEIGDLLDSDGPGPGEDRAYQRESLTLAPAENGVRFRGFLANENAELLRSWTHAGARPHKTIDGELDPRPREKRQADALTTALSIAAAVTDTGSTPTPTAPATATDTGDTPPAPRPTGTARPAPTATGSVPPAGTFAAADAVPPAAMPTGTGCAAAGADTARADTARAATGSARPASAGPGPAANAEARRTPGASDAPDLAAGNGAATSAAHDPAATAMFPTPAPADGDLASSGTTRNPAAATTRDPAATTTGGPAAGAAGVAGATGGWVPGFGAKANITVTIDFNDLKAATADATGQLVYGDALSAAAIRRLACDAAIVPLVLGSNSEPLDVGRSERLVNRAMRRALNARDKGCVVCGAPPVQCDAHHVRSWIDGGPTAISNLVLLCRRHHIDLHAGHWTITITNGTVQVSRPTWADPPPLNTRRPTPERVGTTARSKSGQTPAVAQTPPSVNRWSDDAARREAARLAVWGETPADGTAADIHGTDGEGPDELVSPRASQASDQAIRTTNPVNLPTGAPTPADRFDPWSDGPLADDAVPPPAPAGLSPGP